MIYRREYELGSRKERRLQKAVRELCGQAEMLGNEAESLEYSLKLGLRGMSFGETLREIRAEAEEVLNMVGKIEGMVEEGVLICRI